MSAKLFTPLAVNRRKTGLFPLQMSITSSAGAGSTTLRKRLQKGLKEAGFTFRSGGDTMRQRALEEGYDNFSEFVATLAKDPANDIDRWLDRQIVEWGMQDKMVGEARVPHALMPDAFKVLMKCHVKERAYRRHRELIADGKKVTYEWVLMDLIMRDIRDAERNALRCPGSDWQDEHYDFVIHTDFLSEAEVEARILKAHLAWIAQRRRN